MLARWISTHHYKFSGLDVLRMHVVIPLGCRDQAWPTFIAETIYWRDFDNVVRVSSFSTRNPRWAHRTSFEATCLGRMVIDEFGGIRGSGY